MKTRIFFLFLALFTARALAADVEVLDISDPEHPQSLGGQVRSVTLRSRANNNSSYTLEIRARYSFANPLPQVVLKIGEEKLPFTSVSKGVGTMGSESSLRMVITDSKIAQQIAQQFHTTVVNRQHPGHQMLVEFIPEKEVFTPGEPMMVTLRITNVGEREFAFEVGTGDRERRMDFSARKIEKGGQLLPVPNVQNLRNTGPASFTIGRRSVKPSQSFEAKVDLSKWFKLEPNSTYSIRGSYSMSFVDPDNSLPRELPPIIWSDYASAGFTIKTGP